MVSKSKIPHIKQNVKAGYFKSSGSTVTGNILGLYVVSDLFLIVAIKILSSIISKNITYNNKIFD